MEKKAVSDFKQMLSKSANVGVGRRKQTTQQHLEYNMLGPLEERLVAEWVKNNLPTDRLSTPELLAQLQQEGRQHASMLMKALAKHKTKPQVHPGTAMPRSSIPKEKLTTDTLQQLGFVPSVVAVPERGQSNLTTWRHPYSGMHLHQHPKRWLFHRDKWPSLAMAIRRYEMENPKATIGDKLEYVVKDALSNSIPHILHEGVPGYMSWTANTALGSRTFSDIIEGNKLPGWKTAPRLLRGGMGIAGTGAGLAGLGYLVNRMLGTNKGDQFSLGRGIGSAAGLTGGVLGARQLYSALKGSERFGKHFQEPGWASTGILAGIPLAGMYLGNRLGNMASKSIRRREEEREARSL
jgi:hypothetical protein